MAVCMAGPEEATQGGTKAVLAVTWPSTRKEETARKLSGLVEKTEPQETSCQACSIVSNGRGGAGRDLSHLRKVSRHESFK